MAFLKFKMGSIVTVALIIVALLNAGCQSSPTTSTSIETHTSSAVVTSTSTPENQTSLPFGSVITNKAAVLTANSVILNGNISILNSMPSVSVSYEWGLTTSYGNSTTGQDMTTGGPFSANLTGLAANTTYHFRAKAEHSGIIYGDDFVFKTYANTVQVKITAGADDGFSGGDVFDNTDTWYEAGQPYNAWIRFTGITIPSGAFIDEAHLAVVVNRWDAGTSLKIYAESTKNPLPPASIADHASRRRTSKGVEWANGSSNLQWQNSPDLSSVIQELVNGYGYSNGAIQLLIDNNASGNGAETVGNTFENTGYAPQLIINYH
jgi:hypothetical protein